MVKKLFMINDGGAVVGGLDPEQTYYVKIINDDEFTLNV
jgi:hypothetical protein